MSKEELDLLVKENPAVPDQNGYLVEIGFFKKLEDYKDGSPKPIVNNKCLLKSGSVKSNVKVGVDFLIVSKIVWEYIESKFSSGTMIEVYILNDGRPETELLQIDVKYKSTSRNFSISRSMKMSDFYNKVYSSYNIPKDSTIPILYQGSNNIVPRDGIAQHALNGMRKLILEGIKQSTPQNSITIPVALSSSNSKKKNKKKSNNIKSDDTKLSETIKSESNPIEDNHGSLSPCGLKNIGNTCYMNSALQCFLSLPSLLNSLDQIKSEVKNDTVTGAFISFCREYLNSRVPISPDGVKKSIGRFNRSFASFGQQDSHEFSSLLIDRLDEDSRMKDGIIRKLFYGIFRALIRCDQCDKTTTTNEPFSTISLSLKSPLKILHIPYDLSIPLHREYRIPEISKYIVYGKDHNSYQISSDTSKFADYIVFEVPNYDETSEIPLMIRLVSSNKAQTPLGYPIIIIVPFGVEVSADDLKDIIWDRIKTLWSDFHQNSVKKQLKILPNKFYQFEKHDNVSCSKDKVSVIVQESNMKDIRKVVIEPPMSLENAIESFFGSNRLDSENMWLCPHCKKETCAYHKVNLECSPENLIIHLKRFSRSKNSTKDTTSINVPQSIDLSKYMSVPGSESIYSLSAISNHSGTLSFGHYTALGKRNDKWYSFNDSSVSLTANPDGSSSSAYLLFYSKI